MTTQPALAADLIQLFFAAMFLIMTMVFLAAPRRLSNHPDNHHPGKRNAD